MKALSVRQPWASLIAAGKKTLEIRSRRTHHRGPLLICAASHRGKTPDSLPRGVALCIVEVLDCRPMIAADQAAAGIPFLPGHFAWVLGQVRRVEPFAVSGQLGLFTVDPPMAIS